MNKQERAYRAIRDRILDGSYGPGYRLVMDALAEELDVSAVPIREAIRRLEAEGLVVYRPNAGAQVAPADAAVWESAMTVLAVLEGYATALAAPCLRARDIARLRDVNRQMAESLDLADVLAFSRLNQKFHFAIHQRCPNQYLVDLLRDTNHRLDAVRATVFTHIPNRGWSSLEEHARLIDLLESRAPFAEIEQTARAHKLRTVEAFQRRQREHELRELDARSELGGSRR